MTREDPEMNSEKKTEFSIKDAWENAVSVITQKTGGFWEKGREKAENQMRSNEMLKLSVKLRLHKNKARVRTVLIGSIVLILAVGCGVYHHVRVFHHYTVISSKERSDDNATKYVVLKKGCILKCNPNGVTCVNGSGEVQWNTTFTMQNPIVDVCGTTVAVADQRGSDVYIFNSKGLMGKFTTEHSLTSVKVAKQGVVAVIMEDGEVTWVNVYDSEGNVIVKNKTSMGETGYPISVDLSADGLKMAVSYLGLNHNNVESRIVFYNFSTVGQNQEGNLVNQVNLEGHIVPEVRFLENNYAVAFRDDGITIFRGNRVPEERSSIDIEEEIISVFDSDEYFGTITENMDEKHDEKYKLQVYRENGGSCFRAYFDMEYTNAEICDGEIVLYNNTEIRIYTTGGKLKFSASYEKPIIEIMPASGGRNYTVVTQDSTDVIRIR